MDNVKLAWTMLNWHGQCKTSMDIVKLAWTMLN